METRYLLLQILSLIIFESHATTYYVAQNQANASDTNPGTVTKPFKTIQAAAYKMLSPGDSCYVKRGIYREEIVITTNDLTFLRYGNDNTVLTGLDTIDRNTLVSASDRAYSCIIPPDIFSKLTGNPFPQVFLGCKEMTISRWPNSDDFLNMSQFATIKVDPTTKDSCNNKFDYVQFRNDTLPKGLPGNTIFCSNGSDGNGYNPTWAYLPFISSSDNILKVGGIDIKIDSRLPVKGTKYYLLGGRSTLDTTFEYFLNNNKLFFIAQSIDGLLEIRTRRFVFTVNKATNVHIEGFTIAAGSISLDSTTNCSISNCTILFPAPYFLPQGQQTGDSITSGVVLSGKRNIIENCVIAHSWGDGVTIKNCVKNFIIKDTLIHCGDDVSLLHDTTVLVDTSIGNYVKNCFIYDVARCGTGAAHITCFGADNVLTGNTLEKSGRYGINHHYATNTTITFNDVSRCDLLTTDGSCIHGYGESSAEIAYNWVHHCNDIGIYADDAPKNFSIHHNVVFECTTGIYSHACHEERGGAKNIRIDSNTIITGGMALNFDGGYSHNVTYRNNIIYGDIFHATARIFNEFTLPKSIDNFQIPWDSLHRNERIKYLPNWQVHDFHLSSYNKQDTFGKGAYLPADRWIPGSTIKRVKEPYIWYP